MNSQEYNFRTSNRKDLDEIKHLMDRVFTEEEGVGDLAKHATLYMPGFSDKNWYLIENKKKELVSALVQVNWIATFNNIKLKVWEQAIVGTLKEHRGNGLIKKLNEELDKKAIENNVDFIIIQGIPGFYNKFGYRYAIEFENHINLDFKYINGSFNRSNFRTATIDDSPLFKEQETLRETIFSLQSIRTKKDWEYLLKYSKEVSYSSDIWIINNKYYAKIQKEGFGEGLIISEISEDITLNALKELLAFLKSIALERNKPYLRFDLSIHSPVTKKIIEIGAEFNRAYGWQVKLLNPVKFLNKIIPILNQRLLNSSYKEYSGVVTLNIDNRKLFIEISKGNINKIHSGVLSDNLDAIIPRDLVEPLFLGYRSIKELQYIRPDLATFNTYDLLNVLFPPLKNWLYSIW